MSDNIKILKENEHKNWELDELKEKEKVQKTAVSAANSPYRKRQLGLLLIVIGLLAFVGMQSESVWHYWWLLFFIKPFFFFKFGKCGIFTAK